MELTFLNKKEKALLVKSRLKRMAMKRALVGAVTGNRWWVSLRIRDFATEYSQQLNLDRTKEVKSIDDRLSQALPVGTPKP